MKRMGLVHAAMLSFLLMGTASLVYAQHEGQGKDQGRQQKQAGPARSQGHQRAQQQQNAQPQQHAQQQRGQDRQRMQKQPAGRTRQQQSQRAYQQRHAQQGDRQRGVWDRQRASNFDSQHQRWGQRGGYHGYRVPNARFQRRFGRDHSFHLYGLPFMLYGGRPRFQYGGYWFNVMEPYPEYWGTDWYRNDDMYVDYDGDGYYLYDRRFPGHAGVAISISF